MGIEALIAQIRASMATRLNEREQHRQVIANVRGACNPAGGTARQPDDTEAEQVRGAEQAIVAIDTEIEAQQARIADLEAELARDNAATALQRSITPQNPGVPDPNAPGNGGDQRRQPQPYDHVIKVGDTTEPRTYTPERSRSGEASWISDAFKAHVGQNTQARDRLERRGREVEHHREISQRALNTGGVAGLVPPQFLKDLAAPILRAGRPYANAINRHQLPAEGMQLVIPRGTTGASADAQATENSQVSTTDEAWANVTVPVCTVAGAQQVSRQTLERGAGNDEIIFGDLVRAHAARVDNLLWNGSGTNGQPKGALNTAGIGAATTFGVAPGVANQQLKIAGAITAVTSAGAGIFPKFIFMHPRRWGWLTGLVDSANRPIVAADAVAVANALALIQAPGKMGGDEDPVKGLTIVGVHSSGLPVITDLNMPTTVGTNNEDVELVADTAEHHLWEQGDGLPEQLTFEQQRGDQLTTTLVVYSYIAYTIERYLAASAKVGGVDTTAGNGLVAPTF